MKSTNSRMTYAQLVSDVRQWCNSIGFSDCISEIARCVRSQMYLCGVGETSLSHPTMRTICEAIAASSLYKEIEAAGVAARAQPYKAQNAAMRWAEKVAAELIADDADYASVKARVFEQAGVEDEEAETGEKELILKGGTTIYRLVDGDRDCDFEIQELAPRHRECPHYAERPCGKPCMLPVVKECLPTLPKIGTFSIVKRIKGRVEGSDIWDLERESKDFNAKNESRKRIVVWRNEKWHDCDFGRGEQGAPYVYDQKFNPYVIECDVGVCNVIKWRNEHGTA